MTKDPKAAHRMARKRERDRAAGIVEVIVKVPMGREEEVKRMAARLMEEAEG